jgi:hypothetical protein
MTSIDDFDADLRYTAAPSNRLPLSRSGSSLVVALGIIVLTAAAAAVMALGADVALASVLTAIFGFGAAFIGGLVSASTLRRAESANNMRVSITFSDNLARLEAKKRLFEEVGQVEEALVRVVALHLGEAGLGVRSADLVKYLHELRIMSSSQIAQWHEVLSVRARMLDFSVKPVPEDELFEACNKAGELLEHLKMTERSYHDAEDRMHNYDDDLVRAARARIVGETA